MTARPPLTDKVRIRANLHTFSLIGLVLAMWYAGAVQSNGAATLLAFLTATIGAISYVHARANLRGLLINAGSVPAAREGKAASMPITLHAASRTSPCGLEVLAVGSASAAFVNSIASGTTERLTLKLPPPATASPNRLAILVRSAYPLGLFSAERVIEVEAQRMIIPTPSGDLPLPPPDPALRTEALSLASQQIAGSRSGDDFAGLRNFQLGDSPRHIDWRAAARGRPLMVKTWAASAAGKAVHLDWQTVTLPEEQRAGQIAQWIHTCEAEGIPYALTLPQTKISIGLGPDHERGCLQALAAVHAERAATAVGAAKKPRIPRAFEKSAHLPAEPLIALCSILLLAVVPLIRTISPLSLGLLAICFLWRIVFAKTLRSWWQPLTAMVAGLAATWFSFGEFESLESRISVLVVVLSAKLLESRTPHDFQVLSMIGWFLCLCALTVEQTLLWSIYTLTVFALITAGMVRFRRSVAGAKTPLKFTAILLAQALPLVAILFFIFPRLDMENLVRFGGQRISRTGIPPDINPGSISQIAKSDETAFRVKFPDGPAPPNQMRYWRCLVMWQCDGLRWTPGPRLAAPPPKFLLNQRDAVRQIIYLEPHGQSWLPALDWPISGRDQIGLLEPNASDLLTSFQPVMKLGRIEVSSRLQSDATPLKADQRAAALQLPGDISPRVREVAQQWLAAAAGNDALVVQQGLNFFSKGFQYTLEPGEYSGPSNLEDFLFRRRVGFCEHFSAGFATLMRLAGVPCRIVVGYLGGELSERTGQLIVKQSDAHAWTEVWLAPVGWARVDPTAALAPSRVTGNLRSFLEASDEALARQHGNIWWRARQEMRQLWDDVNNVWYDFIVSFDSDAQTDWLMWAGINRDRRTLFLISIAVMAAALIALGLWLRRPAHHPDPWARAWLRLTDRLNNRLGLPARTKNEGPMAYAQRVASHRPEIIELAAAYATARYGQATMSLRDFNHAVRRLR